MSEEYILNFGYCPDCGTQFVFDRENTAWTEEQDLVVVPLVCPNCRYSGGAHIRLTPVAADAEHE